MAMMTPRTMFVTSAALTSDAPFRYSYRLPVAANFISCKHRIRDTQLLTLRQRTAAEVEIDMVHDIIHGRQTLGVSVVGW